MEDENADDIPSEENSNHFPSADVTVGDTCASYVAVEINHDLSRFPTANSTVDEKSAKYAKVELTDNHSSFPSENSTVEEKCTSYATVELTHDHFRFAYDLVELVLKIRKELNSKVPHNLPEPSIYLFTEDHARIVKRLLRNDTSYLLLQIHKLSNGVYDYDNYLMCREFFVQKWKNKVYTEKSFINACASIAFIAAHFIQANSHCGALDNVVEFIAIWVRDIMERGTIDNSCW